MFEEIRTVSNRFASLRRLVSSLHEHSSDVDEGPRGPRQLARDPNEVRHQRRHERAPAPRVAGGRRVLVPHLAGRLHRPHAGHQEVRHGLPHDWHDACCSLLNSCYGGVALDFSGEIGQRDYCPKNYGRLAPLFRPYKYNYAPTVSGMQRAARVQALLDSLA